MQLQAVERCNLDGAETGVLDLLAGQRRAGAPLLASPSEVVVGALRAKPLKRSAVADRFFALMPSLSASSASVCPRATQSGIELPSGRSAKVNFVWN
jgi:hypothetical protein